MRAYALALQVSLGAGEQRRVTLQLSARDVSIWSEQMHAWDPVRGTFKAHGAQLRFVEAGSSGCLDAMRMFRQMRGAQSNDRCFAL